MRQHVLARLGRIGGIDAGGQTARKHAAQVGQEPFGGVEADDANAVARLQSQLYERLKQTLKINEAVLSSQQKRITILKLTIKMCKFKNRIFSMKGGSVSDPHSLYADPDSTFLTNADPDPDPSPNLI
jgi:hypothetical protein